MEEIFKHADRFDWAYIIGLLEAEGEENQNSKFWIGRLKEVEKFLNDDT